MNWVCLWSGVESTASKCQQKTHVERWL